MTTTPNESEEEITGLLRSMSLESLILWESSVTRGATTDLEPGGVNANIQVETVVTTEGEAQFTVTGKYEFMNGADELIAEVSVSYRASYTSAAEGAIPEEVTKRFVRSVMMQVTPFQREFLASTTNRLGMSPFYLPLLRRSEIKFDEESNV